jgi:hypothetical protein
MSLLKRISNTSAFQETVGTLGAWYLKLVWHSSRVTLEPATIYEAVQMPAIIAMWHGQHFLMPFIKPAGQRAKVLISRHHDGEINAIAAERLGIETIRGSGSHGSDFSRKGGILAFNEIVGALQDGCNVALTADVPKLARVAGLGIIKIAQVSGRPIYPMAIATRRRIELDNWDRTAVNLPFGRGGGVAGAPIYVPAEANAATLELARRALEEALNAVTNRAYEIADRSGGGRERV